MCAICDGMSWEELERRMETAFSVFGWVWTGVEPEGSNPGWVYTVGLSESFGHPDILIRDGMFEAQCRALRYLATAIAEAVTDVEGLVAAAGLRMSTIHAAELCSDTLVDWEHRYGRRPERHELVEVHLPLWARDAA